MEINNCKYRLRCEMGACGKRAEFTIQPARVGIRSSVHVCRDCLDAIIKEGGRAMGGGDGETKRSRRKSVKAVTAKAEDIAAQGDGGVVSEQISCANDPFPRPPVSLVGEGGVVSEQISWTNDTLLRPPVSLDAVDLLVEVGDEG